MIPSSREVCIDIQLDAQAERARRWPRHPRRLEGRRRGEAMAYGLPAAVGAWRRPSSLSSWRGSTTTSLSSGHTSTTLRPKWSASACKRSSNLSASVRSSADTCDFDFGTSTIPNYVPEPKPSIPHHPRGSYTGRSNFLSAHLESQYSECGTGFLRAVVLSVSYPSSRAARMMVVLRNQDLGEQCCRSGAPLLTARRRSERPATSCRST